MEEEVEGQVYELADLVAGPSRSERLFGPEWRKKVLNKSDLPYPEVLYVHCPRHAHYLMTPIKIFRSYHGYSVLFQCHYIDEKDQPCLMINQIYESLTSKSWMRPGDVLDYESDWSMALEKVVELNNADRVTRPSGSKQVEELVITKAPPNPWNKPLSTAYIIWDVFWEKIIQNGECTFDELEAEYLNRKGTVDRQYRDYTLGSQPLDEWIYHRTGFIIKKYGFTWKVIGRGEGKSDRIPWSEESYRKEFGFEE